MDLRRVARDDLGGDLAPASVKEDNLIRRPEAQDVAAMMRFRTRQDERVGIPIFGRDIKAMHAEKGSDFSVQVSGGEIGILNPETCTLINEKILSRDRRSF